MHHLYHLAGPKEMKPYEHFTITNGICGENEAVILKKVYSYFNAVYIEGQVS